MKAIQYESVGAPLQLVTIPKPQPAKGHVLIKQRYSSINPMDHKLQMLNLFKNPLPATLGYDVCGTVVELGEGASKFKVGDEVFGLPTGVGACFAEYVSAVDKYLGKRTIIPGPEAGGSTVAFGTAWFTLYPGLGEDMNTVDPFAKKYQGKTIFIPGGGGGLGHVLIQLAKKSGFKVIASASKPESIQLSKDCGADHVIDYSKSDVVKEVLVLTNNEGVDVVVDATYSPASFAQSPSMAKKGGKWICVANAFGEQHKEALKICEARGVTAIDADFGRYWAVPKYIAVGEAHIGRMLEYCDKLYGEGVHVRVTKVIPMELEVMKDEVLASGQGKRAGKVVVKIAGDN